MPRFDGTGPEGKGPLTGRKKGKCKDVEKKQEVVKMPEFDRTGPMGRGPL